MSLFKCNGGSFACLNTIEAVFEWPDQKKIDIDKELLKKSLPTGKGNP
jgi:hypothetical protein